MFDPNAFPQLDGPVTFTLDNGVELHRESPDTFYLPAEEERASLRPRDFAKLIFRMTDGEQIAVERMWVIVREARTEDYVGMLNNQPYCTKEIGIGLSVQFHADHVIQIRRMS